ncbi:MAG: hypothetical protein V4723_06460 [Pseudomonadota bacterium]
MNDPKKLASAKESAYKTAAAARRQKLASTVTPGADEIPPHDGRIRVPLSGKPISPTRNPKVFGESSIDIPEFLIVRKK